jgi:hypothetical protein
MRIFFSYFLLLLVTISCAKKEKFTFVKPPRQVDPLTLEGELPTPEPTKPDVKPTQPPKPLNWVETELSFFYVDREGIDDFLGFPLFFGDISKLTVNLITGILNIPGINFKKEFEIDKIVSIEDFDPNLYKNLDLKFLDLRILDADSVDIGLFKKSGWKFIEQLDYYIEGKGLAPLKVFTFDRDNETDKAYLKKHDEWRIKLRPALATGDNAILDYIRKLKKKNVNEVKSRFKVKLKGAPGAKYKIGAQLNARVKVLFDELEEQKSKNIDNPFNQ